MTWPQSLARNLNSASSHCRLSPPEINTRSYCKCLTLKKKNEGLQHLVCILYLWYTCILHCGTFQFRQVGFQVLTSHMWLLAFLLDSWNLDHCIVKVTQLSASRFWILWVQIPALLILHASTSSLHIIMIMRLLGTSMLSKGICSMSESTFFIDGCLRLIEIM